MIFFVYFPLAILANHSVPSCDVSFALSGPFTALSAVDADQDLLITFPPLLEAAETKKSSFMFLIESFFAENDLVQRAPLISNSMKAHSSTFELSHCEVFCSDTSLRDGAVARTRSFLGLSTNVEGTRSSDGTGILLDDDDYVPAAAPEDFAPVGSTNLFEAGSGGCFLAPKASTVSHQYPQLHEWAVKHKGASLNWIPLLQASSECRPRCSGQACAPELDNEGAAAASLEDLLPKSITMTWNGQGDLRIAVLVCGEYSR